MTILIAAFSVMVSYGIISAIPALKDADKPVSVKVAEEISTDLEQPDTSVFSEDAINPTVPVTIGEEE